MEIYMNELKTEIHYELPKNMKFIQELDHGSFGKVILVKESNKNIDLAIKVISKVGAGLQAIKSMKEEISILKQLNHENIVKFYGYIETKSQLLIEMEYIKYGTLSRWIKDKKKISETEASLLLGKVLSAVEYLHNSRICHRDIKPENIMFSKKNDFSSIKIIDFGLSAQHLNYLYNKEYCGTFIYMAPEQIEKKLYYYSVDMWSIGILMYMLLNNGKHPFYKKGDEKEDYIEQIKIGKINFINKVSYMAKNLIYKLLEPNPSWRYSANLAIKHPWITRNAKDDIPLTFNEILIRNNNRKNAINLLMVNIFLNHFKKSIIKNNKINLTIKKNSKLFKINSNYINQCELVSKEDRENNDKLKERYLEVLSTDEEDSFEKNRNNDINKNKFNTINGEIKTAKNFFEDISKNKVINGKIFKQVNIAQDKSLNLKRKLIYRNNQQKTIKVSKKSSTSRFLSLPNKNKNLKLILREKNLNNNYNFKSRKNSFCKSNKNINKNKIILNSNEENKVKMQKNNSINKIFINKNKIDNENEKIDIFNKIEKTPEKNKCLVEGSKYKLKSNLPYVSKFCNNFIKSSNKKISNFKRNYNIIPLVLPFVGVK